MLVLVGGGGGVDIFAFLQKKYIGFHFDFSTLKVWLAG